MPRQPLLIDTDCGVDDALAMWFLVSLRRFEITTITTVHGNTSAAQAAFNVRRVLSMLPETGRIKVIPGATSSLGPAPIIGPAREVHGEDGLGGGSFAVAHYGAAPANAADIIESEVVKAGGDLSIICLGPLTNIAQWIQKYGPPGGRIQGLTVMGGAVAVHGNATAAAEANLARDPYSAHIVFSADWGDHKPLLIPLDATMRATLANEEATALERSTHPLATLIVPGYRLFRDYTRRLSRDTSTNPCHDLLAAAAMSGECAIETSSLPIAIVTAKGLACGQTIADFRVPLWARFGVPPDIADFHEILVAIDADVDGFRRLFRHHVLNDLNTGA